MLEQRQWWWWYVECGIDNGVDDGMIYCNGSDGDIDIIDGAGNDDMVHVVVMMVLMKWYMVIVVVTMVLLI